MLTSLLRQLFGRLRAPPAPLPVLTRALREALPGLLGERVRVAAVAAPAAPDGELFRLWSAIPGGHKWQHYFAIYESLLAPLRTRPIRLLEIGVFHGGSLRMWRAYLHPDSVIVGIDVNPACRLHDDAVGGGHVRIGAQQDPAFLGAVVREFGPFDVILDDGGHLSADIAASFDALFRHGLREGGLYLVEDTQTSYRAEFNRDAVPFVETAKGLADMLHWHHTREAGPQAMKQFAPGHAARLAHVDMPWLTAWLSEIRFHGQMVVFIKKHAAALPVELQRDAAPAGAGSPAAAALP